jgi:hypothetical protein
MTQIVASTIILGESDEAGKYHLTHQKIALLMLEHTATEGDIGNFIKEYRSLASSIEHSRCGSTRMAVLILTHKRLAYRTYLLLFSSSLLAVPSKLDLIVQMAAFCSYGWDGAIPGTFIYGSNSQPRTLANGWQGPRVAIFKCIAERHNPWKELLDIAARLKEIWNNQNYTLLHDKLIKKAKAKLNQCFTWSAWQKHPSICSSWNVGSWWIAQKYVMVDIEWSLNIDQSFDNDGMQIPLPFDGKTDIKSMLCSPLFSHHFCSFWMKRTLL